MNVIVIEELQDEQNVEDPMAATMDRMVRFVLRVKTSKSDSQNHETGRSASLRSAYEHLGLPPPENPDDPLGGQEYRLEISDILNSKCSVLPLIRYYFDHDRSPIGTLSQTIVKTLQKWVRYEKIEEDELVRKIFALLYRQYDAVGEVHYSITLSRTFENIIKDI